MLCLYSLEEKFLYSNILFTLNAIPSTVNCVQPTVTVRVISRFGCYVIVTRRQVIVIVVVKVRRVRRRPQSPVICSRLWSDPVIDSQCWRSDIVRCRPDNRTDSVTFTFPTRHLVRRTVKLRLMLCQKLKTVICKSDGLFLMSKDVERRNHV